MNSVAATTGLDKRLFVIAIIISILAFTFWAGSRVPALNEKAMMGGETSITTLGFDVVLKAEPDDPVFTKIIYTTVNWAFTNKQGMSARGARIETTLAAMMSSPTLNFVVVGMLFSMLPIYLVAIKFAFTLGVILIVVPVLARFVLGREVEQSMT